MKHNWILGDQSVWQCDCCYRTVTLAYDDPMPDGWRGESDGDTHYCDECVRLYENHRASH